MMYSQFRIINYFAQVTENIIFDFKIMTERVQFLRRCLTKTSVIVMKKIMKGI